MTAQGPHVLDPPLLEALHRLVETPTLLVALDFDGTLAPFVDRPLDARMLPAAKRALQKMVTLADTSVVFISGRPVESLAHVTEADDDTLLVGSHGVEERLGRLGGEITLTDEESSLLYDLGSALHTCVSAVTGARFEVKPVGFGVHYRGLADEVGTRLKDRALRIAQEIAPQALIRHGKDVVEFSLRSANKGDAVRHLREVTGATAVLFAGDDATDEDGFRALGEGDVGVKVGAGATQARYRVRDEEEIALLVALVADLRDERIRRA